MKDNNGPRAGEAGKGKANQGRWSRDINGALRYKGICPFNRGVCKLINTLTRAKSGQKAV